jgi:putative ABC transport system ATP-binding protein
VTHDVRLESYADRIIHIDDGRITDDRRADVGAAPIDHSHHQPAPAHLEQARA